MRRGLLFAIPVSARGGARLNGAQYAAHQLLLFLQRGTLKAKHLHKEAAEFGTVLRTERLSIAQSTRLQLLFGGGLSLASAVAATGLDAWFGVQASGLSALPLILLIAAVVAIVLFLTEVTSNTATAATFIPILGGVALGIGVDPMGLLVPAAFAATCAFMLPVGTPPNAIVFSTGAVTIAEMARGGLVLNLVGVVLSAAALFLIVFGLQEGESYDWNGWIWTMIAGGVVLLVLFVWTQARTKSEPLVPLEPKANKHLFVEVSEAERHILPMLCEEATLCKFFLPASSTCRETA